MNDLKAGTLLIVDDNLDLLNAAKIFLKRHFKRVDIESNPNLLPTLLQNDSYDIILLDMNFTRDVSTGQEGYHWLNKILEIDPSAIVILITAYGDVNTAVKAIKHGATDFVLKPWENDKLLATLNASLKLKSASEKVTQLQSQQKQLNADIDRRFRDIIGKSDAIQHVFDTIKRVARTDANVLITGENGTGKELIARAIHRNSLRDDAVFVTVDLGAVTDSLFESELFGHKKGAFTDAKEDRAGRFEVAQNGTLFLDEIGNISLPQQAKLLTALQNRKITRVGSNKAIDIDIRLISATNMSINEMINEGKFRQDLLYRINTIEIKLPALRERPEDIPLLVEHYIKFYSKKYNKEIHKASDATLARMIRYDWPGNIRELQHSIERAVIMSNHNILQPEDFFFQSTQHEDRKNGNVNLDHLNIEDVEKILIRKALDKNFGNITQAAQELGLTRSSLYRRLEKYGL
ncbi:sigma-54-dependent Fis family transcriptional regulator [Marivirga sp. S37H4]|uniref:Sigma-54-dependent Fis family transcriptional regulator n=1 Tax=Marivirga aurantiaca TaxID=2802615 RepID=A0A934X0R6_9BACT|nr:sigma-54 dependent transcriptional regulator [Marivirga aurantiaca]MBK6266347.1 sigma-54-dependent Fis family transcriptional regulator [Marivirga aurantiaca]